MLSSVFGICNGSERLRGRQLDRHMGRYAFVQSTNSVLSYTWWHLETGGRGDILMGDLS